jgi:hypothetical protein
MMARYGKVSRCLGETHAFRYSKDQHLMELRRKLKKRVQKTFYLCDQQLKQIKSHNKNRRKQDAPEGYSRNNLDEELIDY